MKVQLLASTENVKTIIATAARLCYSNDSIEDIMKKGNEDAFLERILSLGHMSVIEHANFTFSIEGISRNAIMQLTRHRVASFSVRSGRYCSAVDNFEYYIPEEFSDEEKRQYIKSMEEAYYSYAMLKNSLTERYIANGMSPNSADKKATENARNALPGSTLTAVVFTMNARELIHVLQKRMCSRAQEEIREAATLIFKELYTKYPDIFIHALPTCSKGKCPEGTMSCGKKVKVGDYIE